MSARTISGKGAALTENLSSVTFVTDNKGRVIVSEVILNTPTNTFLASGSSKRMTGDPRDAELGELLALEKAVDELQVVIKSRITDIMS